MSIANFASVSVAEVQEHLTVERPATIVMEQGLLMNNIHM